MNTLESVKQRIDQWRESIPNKRGRVPVEIKLSVLELAESFPSQYLTHYFGFGNSTIRKWQTAPIPAHATALDMIEITPSLVPVTALESFVEVTATRQDVQLQASLSITQLQLLLFDREVSSC